MDIGKRLQEEHSKNLTSAIVKYVDADPKKIKVLMSLFLHGDYTMSQRSGWALSECAIKYPELITRYMGQLVKKLGERNHHPAVYRNILRIFQATEIPQKYSAKMVELSFGFVMNETEPIAIRAFSITVASNLCKQFPDLKNELLVILNTLSQLPQKPAIGYRVKSALKELQKIKS